jgi:hypothetical protein
MSALQRWLGLIGLASILALAVGLGLPLLVGRPVPTPTRTILLNVLFLTGAFRIFYPLSWRPLVGLLAGVVALTSINSLPVMNTDTALWASWCSIAIVGLVIWFYEKRHGHASRIA